jgi:DNA-binding transcriptional MerR regulator
MPQKVKTDFTAAEAALFSGLTRHMVNYLCRTGVLIPSLSPRRTRGRARRYSFGDVVMLRVMDNLLKRGVEVARLKDALAGLRRFHPEIRRDSLPNKMLFTDGRRIYFKSPEDIVEDVARGQYVFGFVLELKAIRAEVLKTEQSLTHVTKRRRTGT